MNGRCEWMCTVTGPKGGRRPPKLCNAGASHEAEFKAGNWRELSVMQLCPAHLAPFRAVWPNVDPRPLPLVEYYLAVAWCLRVADTMGERLHRITRADKYPYTPPEPLDWTAGLIYRRARERLAAARARLGMS